MSKSSNKIQKSIFINALKGSFALWVNDKIKNNDLEALERFNLFLKNEKLIGGVLNKDTNCR